MSDNRLSALQWEILGAVATVEPAFTLTGGAALAGVYLRHRTTRDLDLFWRERRELGQLVDQIRDRLTASGFGVTTVQTSSTHYRLQVVKDQGSCLVDLVAEPFSALLPPRRVEIGGKVLLVDTPREILASKLTALLSRSELRDLQDVQALLALGESLEQGVADAAQKDGGFSPLTLAWTLRSLDVRLLASALGWSEEESRKLIDFKEWLLERVLSLADPEG